MFDSAVVMGREALRQAGVPGAEIERVEREYRSRDCERLERQIAAGDLHAGYDQSFGPDRSLPDESGRAGEKPGDEGPIDSALDEGPADPAHKNQG